MIASQAGPRQSPPERDSRENCCCNIISSDGREGQRSYLLELTTFSHFEVGGNDGRTQGFRGIVGTRETAVGIRAVPFQHARRSDKNLVTVKHATKQQLGPVHYTRGFNREIPCFH